MDKAEQVPDQTSVTEQWYFARSPEPGAAAGTARVVTLKKQQGGCFV
jgi:hypothetical protein